MRANALTAIVAISGLVANTKRRAFESPLRTFDAAYPSTSNRLGVSDIESGMKGRQRPTEQQSRAAEARQQVNVHRAPEAAAGSTAQEAAAELNQRREAQRHHGRHVRRHPRCVGPEDEIRVTMADDLPERDEYEQRRSQA